MPANSRAIQSEATLSTVTMPELLVGQGKRKPEVNPLAALLPYIFPVLSPL